MGQQLNSEIEDFVVGDTLQIVRYLNIAQLGTDTVSKCWFTVKDSASDADADAILQKVGTVVDSGSGTPRKATIQFSLSNTETALMTGDVTYLYDIQIKTAGGVITTPEKGTITGRLAITRATS